MSLRAGDTVEHFVIVSPLGEGGMGQVYLARDTRLQRSIALKIMQPEAAGDVRGQAASNGAARLLREAQAAAGLEHPNVVTIYEVGEIKGEGEEAGRPFIAMELVKGKALRELVGDANVPMKERIRVLADVARALGAAHKAGLVHRDIKPENVMVREDGVVKVLDFGLAKRATPTADSLSSSTEAQVLPSLTGKGVAIGTPYYMAPEQMRREVLDGRADQFSWGVVAYELLSGTPTWGREIDALELVSKLLSEDPRPLEEVCPEVPAHVAAVVTRALAKRKGARFETMEAVVAALEDASGVFAPTMPKISVSEPELPKVASERGVRAPPAAVETTKRLSVRARRPWPVVASVVGAAVAVSALVGVAVWKRGGGATIAAKGSGGADIAASSAHRGCATNAECTRANGKPSICHHDDGACATLESEDCKVHADERALGSEDTVWVGAMYPLTGPLADFGATEMEGVELGRRDFAEILGGATSGAMRARPIGLVACDDGAAPSRAARHLVEDARVPAVIGFARNGEVVELAQSLFVPRGVLAMSGHNDSPLLSTIPQPKGAPRLVWRTIYNATQMAAPLASLVEAVLEPAVRRTNKSSPLRVALVRPKTMTQLAFADAVQRVLVFNGRGALLNGANYLDLSVDDPYGAGTPVFEPAIARLADFEPDIVIYDTPALMARVFGPFENRLSKSARPPFYASTLMPGPEELAYVGKSTERRHRFFGLTCVSATPTNARLAAHFNETFDDKVTLNDTPNGSYDAFYVLAYAGLSTRASPVTGADLSRAIARLVPPGKPVEVGPLGILDGYDALAGGSNIDLEGALGHLDFDLSTGEALVDMAVVCIDVDRHGTASGVVESGMVYESHTHALTGAMRCP